MRNAEFCVLTFAFFVARRRTYRLDGNLENFLRLNLQIGNFGRWESSIISTQHSALRIPHSDFRIPISAFRIPHSDFHIATSA